MVLFKDFKSTSYAKAFILNSIAIGLSAAVGIEVRSRLQKINLTTQIRQYISGGVDEQIDKSGFKDTMTEGIKFIITFLFSFGVSILVFFILHYLFGFGGGMLINTSN